MKNINPLLFALRCRSRVHWGCCCQFTAAIILTGAFAMGGLQSSPKYLHVIFFIRDCRYKAEPLLTIPFCMSLDAGREEDMTFYTLGPVILLSSTNGHWTAWRSMAKRWWGLLWEPPWQPRRDLGGTLITTQVRSSELYVPNCEKLPAEESALITSWKKVVISCNIPHTWYQFKLVWSLSWQNPSLIIIVVQQCQITTIIDDNEVNRRPKQCTGSTTAVAAGVDPPSSSKERLCIDSL